MKNTKLVQSVYSRDASRIVGNVSRVYNPTSIEEIQRIINENTEDIIPRGSGSNLVGGCVPNNSVVVDMRKLNRVINFDANRKTAIVESGITIKELNEKLKQAYFEFPIEFNELSTIGGMAAMNTFGEKSLRYGAFKDCIDELEFVNGKAEIIKLGRADLAEVCGMEGTTGIITKIKLRLMKIPDRSVSILQSDSIDEILSVCRKLKNEAEVVTIKFYSKKASLILGLPEKYNVFIFFDSSRGKINGEDYNNLIKKIKMEYYFLYNYGYYDSDDARFYYDKLKDFILHLEGISCPFIGDLGAAIINPFFKPNEISQKMSVMEFMKKTGAKKGRYGIGIKRKYLVDPLDKKIYNRIKKRHDPQEKFNKGKLIDFDLSFERKIEELPIEKIKSPETQKIEEKSVNENKIISPPDNKLTNDLTLEKIEKPIPRNMDLIRNIMTNSIPENGKTIVKDNLERQPNNNNKEKDLIKSIMFNKLKDKKEGSNGNK